MGLLQFAFVQVLPAGGVTILADAIPVAVRSAAGSPGSPKEIDCFRDDHVNRPRIQLIANQTLDQALTFGPYSIRRKTCQVAAVVRQPQAVCEQHEPIHAIFVIRIDTGVWSSQDLVETLPARDMSRFELVVRTRPGTSWLDLGIAPPEKAGC